MFTKIKNLLSRGDSKKLHEAEVEFDHLMKEVDTDVKDLAQLEGRVHDEFGRLHGEVKKFEEEVDELMN